MRTPLGSLALLGWAFGCQPVRSLATPPGARLEQTVRLSPTTPTTGQVLRIQSTIINRGTSPIDVTSRTCGLDTKGDLELSGSLLMCAAFSRQVTLMPADSLSAFDARVVTSPPGRYTLRVRHALDPDRWVELPVAVE
jgi:hypothetical protein